MIAWVRLWHDMPTDPKFRTIARIAKQPLASVVAVYVFMLTDASANAAERGRTQADDETIASALDLDEDAVSAIRSAMQGRVLDGPDLSGWGKRQPKREDDSADRAKVWREAQRAKQEAERIRTQANASERQDKDAEEDKEEEEEKKDINNHPPALRPHAQEAGGQALEDDLEGKNAAFDEAARRLRSAWHERGLEPPDMSRVDLWLEQGHSVATIVAVVRERLAAGGSKARGLSYFDRSLAEAKPQQDEPKPLGACLPTVYVRQLDPAWPVYAEAWKAAKGKPPPTDRAGGWHFPIDLIPAEHA